MSRDDIIEMAREAGITLHYDGVTLTGLPTPITLERFAALVAAKEREAIKPAIIEALKAETREMENYSYFGSNKGVSVDDYEDIADAAVTIRARIQ